MTEKQNGRNDLWLKVLIGLIITLFVAGFGFIEARKLDKGVFDIHRQNVTKQLDRIETKIDKIVGKKYKFEGYEEQKEKKQIWKEVKE